MGLDVYALRSLEEPLAEEDVLAFDKANIELCGGIFSGDGGSFRGKVYDTLILDITEVSLYQQWIPTEIVREMAAALHLVDRKEFDKTAPEKYRYEKFNSYTIEHLCRFFDVCVERGLGLAGDW
jgi:hypothetical protein